MNSSHIHNHRQEEDPIVSGLISLEEEHVPHVASANNYSKYRLIGRQWNRQYSWLIGLFVNEGQNIVGICSTWDMLNLIRNHEQSPKGLKLNSSTSGSQRVGKCFGGFSRKILHQFIWWTMLWMLSWNFEVDRRNFGKKSNSSTSLAKFSLKEPIWP